MQRWEYLMLESWWEEAGRSEDYNTRISYRHVWQPGDEVVEYPKGMSAEVGAHGWELVTITSFSQSLITVESRQGNHGYASVPTHKSFFKRPVED